MGSSLDYQGVLRDVHDPTNHALQISGTINAAGQATVNINGSATIFAVVNTGSAADPKIYIGLTTATIGNSVVLGNGVGNIGFSTVFLGTPTINAVVNTGSATDPKIYIGLTTTTLGTGTSNIGSVSILGGGIGINAGVNNIGFATVNVVNSVGNATLNPSPNYIGLTTNVNASAWPDPKTFIGLATTVNGAGTQFIGLVTAVTRNAGTSKTLVSLPVAISTGSQATIAVPTNANTMYITNLLLNSDATVRVNILSGVSYLNGNATIGITLNPGGGWVETGSPDSPVYIGNPSGAIIVQKFDMTGTSAKIGGKITYFQE